MREPWTISGLILCVENAEADSLPSNWIVLAGS